MSEESVEKNEEVSEGATTEEELETEEVEEEVEGESDDDPNSLKSRNAELEVDNRRQKELLNTLMQMGVHNQGQQTFQQPVVQDVDDDDSDLDPAVAKRLKKMQAQATQQVQGVIGGVLEEMDKSAILSSPRSALYRKYENEVEQFRRNMYAQGRYFKREEALANVLLTKGESFTETPKKKVKKVVKQKVKPAGETQKAETVSSKEKKPSTLKEKLKDVRF